MRSTSPAIFYRMGNLRIGLFLALRQLTGSQPQTRPSLFTTALLRTAPSWIIRISTRMLIPKLPPIPARAIPMATTSPTARSHKPAHFTKAKIAIITDETTKSLMGLARPILPIPRYILATA
jgi:hypothetical protein